LTDGQANEGVTDINNLGVMLKKMIPTNTTIHSLGFTETHNPIFLKKVSEACNNGTYVFIENEDVLRGSFVEIIGKTMEVAYQNVQLTLEADNVNFSDYKTDKDFETLPLGDLHIGETRKWIINTKFTKELPSYEIVAKVGGFNVIEVQQEVNFAEVKLERGDNNVKINEVEDKIILLNTSKAVQLATKLAMERNFMEAERVLRNTSSNLRGFPTIATGLDQLARCCSDNTVLNTSSHRMTSYQQELETENDLIFSVPPSTVLGISPIKTPKKTIQSFFPSSDEDEEIPTIQDVELCSSKQQGLVSTPPNLSLGPQSEGDNTDELPTED
jgi:hypothetical protein